MLIRKAPDLRYSDVTPKSVYLRRREFIQAAAGAAVGAAAALSLRHKRGGEVRLFGLRSALRHPGSAPGEIPHRSRFDCIDGSPQWRK